MGMRLREPHFRLSGVYPKHRKLTSVPLSLLFGRKSQLKQDLNRSEIYPFVPENHRRWSPVFRLRVESRTEADEVALI